MENARNRSHMRSFIGRGSLWGGKREEEKKRVCTIRVHVFYLDHEEWDACTKGCATGAIAADAEAALSHRVHLFHSRVQELVIESFWLYTDSSDANIHKLCPIIHWHHLLTPVTFLRNQITNTQQQKQWAPYITLEAFNLRYFVAVNKTKITHRRRGHGKGSHIKYFSTSPFREHVPSWR